jgi:hypothetical protein
MTFLYYCTLWMCDVANVSEVLAASVVRWICTYLWVHFVTLQCAGRPVFPVLHPCWTRWGTNPCYPLLHLWSSNQDPIHSSVGTAMGHRLDSQGSNPGRGNIFLYSTASRPVLGPTQTLIQWVPGIERPWHEADNSPLTVEVKIELYLHSLVCLHGIVLN